MTRELTGASAKINDFDLLTLELEKKILQVFNEAKKDPEFQNISKMLKK